MAATESGQAHDPAAGILVGVHHADVLQDVCWSGVKIVDETTRRGIKVMRCLGVPTVCEPMVSMMREIGIVCGLTDPLDSAFLCFTAFTNVSGY